MTATESHLQPVAGQLPYSAAGIRTADARNLRDRVTAKTARAER
jgi:hypothetical protein